MKERQVYSHFDKQSDMHLAIFKIGSEYEVAYMYNQEGEEYNTFGGSVGYTDSTFKTLEEAKGFIDKGLEGSKLGNYDIWLEMLEVKLN